MDIKTVENGKMVYFMDQFTVPPKAVSSLLNRIKQNFAFIQQLPGFIRHEAFIKDGENAEDSSTIITVALWQDKSYLKAAGLKVQDKYQSEGFSPSIFMEQLGIQMERQVYSALE